MGGDGEKSADQGHQEAHTPGENSRRGGGGADLAAEIAAAGGDQVSLFEGDPEPLFGGPVRHVADTFEAAKGRGRPKGARNKRSQLMADYLISMGYRDPMQNIADLANADPEKLSAELSKPKRNKAGELIEASCTPGEAMALILKANAELLPYFHSKKPLEVDVRETRLGVLVVGELSAGTPGHGEFLSLTGEIGEAEEDQ